MTKLNFVTIFKISSAAVFLFMAVFALAACGNTIDKTTTEASVQVTDEIKTENVTAAIVPKDENESELTVEENVKTFTWDFDETTATLTISGTGTVYCDWYGYEDYIKNIVIGDSITAIDDRTFVNHFNLASIKIPNSVTSIGDHAFSYCYELKNVYIGSGVEHMGTAVFQDFDSSEYVGCYQLESITVSEDNEHFASHNGVLYDKKFTKLIQYPTGNISSSYIMPNSVTEIDSSALMGCVHLEEITLGSGITFIDPKTFFDCHKLKKITLSENYVKFAGGLISCESIEEICVDEENPYYSSQNGVLFSKDKTQLLFYPYSKSDKHYSIPENVKTIRFGAIFGLEKTERIYVGTNVEVIEPYNFIAYINKMDDTESPTIEVYYEGTKAQWDKLYPTDEYDIYDNKFPTVRFNMATPTTAVLTTAIPQETTTQAEDDRKGLFDWFN